MNTKNLQERAMGQLAKRITVNCVRNTQLELIHQGVSPVTKTGDYGDVRVIDGEGTEIPWTKVSHITDAAMKELMITVVNRIYTALTMGDDPDIAKLLSLHDNSTGQWDAPQIDNYMLQYLRHLEAMVVESERTK